MQRMDCIIQGVSETDAIGRESGYGQYCPIARALEVLGERWSLLILRDMLVGTTRFNDLCRGLPGLSRSLLTKRLRQFERAGLVERLGNEYLLTDAGRQLEPIVFGIGEWGAEWTFGDPDPEELDPDVLVGGCTNASTRPSSPAGATCCTSASPTIRGCYWIVIEQGVPSVCLTNPASKSM